MTPAVSVITVAYDSGASLLRLLQRVGAEADTEAIVVNNGADTDEIRRAAALAHVRVVSPGRNIGYAAGSNVGARVARGDVLVFLNPDTVPAPGALAHLARTLEDATIAIAMPRLRLLDQPDLLNSSGNVVHLSGIAWAGGHGEPADAVRTLRDVAYPSGAAMAIRAELFRELGGFAEALFMYQEDLELAWRARLVGLRIVVDPSADVYHEYEFARNARKLYFLERNRLVFVLSSYSGRLLLVLAPVLVAAELGMLALAAREGWLADKVAGWRWLLRNAGWLARRRRLVQSSRRVPDRELACLLTPDVAPAMIPIPALVRAANPLLRAYWALARRAL